MNTFENKTLSNHSLLYWTLWTCHQKEYPLKKKIFSLSLEREQFSNTFFLLINNSLLSFSFLFLFFPPLPFQFDHFLNAANSKKYQGAIDLWKLAFRKSSLDLARFISDPPRKKFLCTRARVCVSIITTICVNADHPRARTERWLMPPISGSRSLLDRCRSRHASRRHFCYTYRSIVTVVQGLTADT